MHTKHNTLRVCTVSAQQQRDGYTTRQGFWPTASQLPPLSSPLAVVNWSRHTTHPLPQTYTLSTPRVPRTHPPYSPPFPLHSSLPSPDSFRPFPHRRAPGPQPTTLGTGNIGRQQVIMSGLTTEQQLPSDRALPEPPLTSPTMAYCAQPTMPAMQ